MPEKAASYATEGVPFRLYLPRTSAHIDTTIETSTVMRILLKIIARQERVLGEDHPDMLKYMEKYQNTFLLRSVPLDRTLADRLWVDRLRAEIANRRERASRKSQLPERGMVVSFQVRNLTRDAMIQLASSYADLGEPWNEEAVYLAFLQQQEQVWNEDAWFYLAHRPRFTGPARTELANFYCRRGEFQKERPSGRRFLANGETHRGERMILGLSRPW